MLEGFVSRSSPDAVGIEALIQYETLVEGFVVEVRLVALDVNLAHSQVAAHAVDDLACGVLHLVCEVVKEGAFRAPKLLSLDRQHDCRVVLCLDGLRGDNLLAVLQGDRQCGCRLAVECGMQDDLALVDVCDDLCAKQCILIDGFHPYRLPDTRGAGVHALELVEAYILLAGWLLRGTRVAVGMDDERVLLSVGKELRDINGEGSASTEMATSKASVDEHFAVVIDGTEVQHDVASCPFLRHLDVALIPDVVDKVGVANAAELAFGTERNGNLAVEALALEEALLHAGANKVEGVGPFSIEVEPVLALKLWARILSPGQCPSSNCHTKQQERKKQSSHHNSTFNVVVRAKIRKRIKNEEL